MGIELSGAGLQGTASSAQGDAALVEASPSVGGRGSTDMCLR